MAKSPVYKIYFEREYIASCKSVYDAAAIVALRGDGAEIRFGHSLVLWREGKEESPAKASYDNVADICYFREQGFSV